jgi:hypothetical protein
MDVLREHCGHFTRWPAAALGTVTSARQLGQRKRMVDMAETSSRKDAHQDRLLIVAVGTPKCNKKGGKLGPTGSRGSLPL